MKSTIQSIIKVDAIVLLFLIGIWLGTLITPQSEKPHSADAACWIYIDSDDTTALSIMEVGNPAGMDNVHIAPRTWTKMVYHFERDSMYIDHLITFTKQR